MRACELLSIIEELIPSAKGFQKRLVAQKLAYMIERLTGVREHHFMWHRHGPYSRGLAREMRKATPCEAREELMRMARELFSRFGEAAGHPVRGLEIAASLKMLMEEVYPRPEDPVEELLRRKPFLSKEEVMRVYTALTSLRT